MYTNVQTPSLWNAWKTVGLLVAALFIAGCGSTGTPNGAPPEAEPQEQTPAVQEPIQEAEPEPSDFAQDFCWPKRFLHCNWPRMMRLRRGLI